MIWDGELRVAGARILDAQGYAFDTADEGLRDAERRACRVALDHRRRLGRRRSSSSTGPIDAELVLATGTDERARSSCVGSDASGRRFEAGSPERCVELKRLPAAMPATSFAGRFADPAPAPGRACVLGARAAGRRRLCLVDADLRDAAGVT